MDDSSILIMNGYHKPHHRVLKPPGGDTHDIFGTGNASAYNEATEASRKARNANQQAQTQSKIFDSMVFVEPAHTNGKAKKAEEENGDEEIKIDDEEAEDLENSSKAEEKQVDEQQDTRKTVKDHMKSNVFSDWENSNSAAPRRSSNGLGRGNPITGEGYTNGYQNSNVVAKDGSARRDKIPPGGPCSKLW